MSEKKKKTLIEKLAEIYGTVGYMQKKETNSFQNFKYVSSSQVLTEIRAKMVELGVMLEPTITGHNLQHFQNAKGVEQLVTELDMQYTWVNVDDPSDTRVITWYAQGKDSDEKGVGKALTYGEKFFLLKYFNIATDKHDPDAQAPQASAKKEVSTVDTAFIEACTRASKELDKETRANVVEKAGFKAIGDIKEDADKANVTKLLVAACKLAGLGQ